MNLSPGAKAPNFVLKNQNNDDIRLFDLRGKWVVIFFYPKDSTPFCTIEARDFSKYMDHFYKANAEVLGISADSIDSHCRFIAKADLKVNLLSDIDKEVSQLYSVSAEKNIFGIKKSVILRSTFLIDPNGNIDFVWKNFYVTGHASQVLERIKKQSFLSKVNII